MVIFGLNANAATTTQNLSNIENQIFGYENNNLNEKERLNKIENYVYGSHQNSSIKDRLAKLNSDLGLDAERLGAKEKAIFHEAMTEQDYANEPTDPSAQYPIVDNIENALLKQTHKAENIYKRLERLEKKAYGKVSSGSLSERVEKLSALVKPVTPEKTREAYNDYIADNDEYNYFSPSTNGNPRSSTGRTNHTYSTSATPTLFNLEKNILGKAYPEEPNSKRLSRLEKKLLHKDFSTEPEQLRIERLATVSSAQQSSNVYKENKLMQHLATGVQIGSMILLLLAMIL